MFGWVGGRGQESIVMRESKKISFRRRIRVDGLSYLFRKKQIHGSMQVGNSLDLRAAS